LFAEVRAGGENVPLISRVGQFVFRISHTREMLSLHLENEDSIDLRFLFDIARSGENEIGMDPIWFPALNEVIVSRAVAVPEIKLRLRIKKGGHRSLEWIESGCRHRFEEIQLELSVRR